LKKVIFDQGHVSSLLGCIKGERISAVICSKLGSSAKNASIQVRFLDSGRILVLCDDEIESCTASKTVAITYHWWIQK
jgi:hypothetical protein